MNPLPCPFCGNNPFEGHGQNSDSKYYLTVVCLPCKVCMKGHDREELVGRWNRRCAE